MVKAPGRPHCSLLKGGFISRRESDFLHGLIMIGQKRNGFKLKGRRFRSDVSEKFFTQRSLRYCCLEMCECPSLEVPKAMDGALGSLSWGGLPAQAVEWGWGGDKVPFNPTILWFCDSCHETEPVMEARCALGTPLPLSLVLPSRKAHLILRRLEKVSSHCSTLLRSAYIQSRTETMPYLFCRSEEVRPPGMVWYSILKDTKVTCEEKMVSMLRNTYGESKGR